MRAVSTTAIVLSDHTMTVSLPEDIAPGQHKITILLDDGHSSDSSPPILTLQPHPVGPRDPNCTYRREDLYGNGGR